MNSNDDYFEVVCYEGKVKVMNNKEEFILTPNTAFRRINGNLIEKWRSDNDQPTWILGESSFKSVPVKYVIGALERQYEIQFKTNGIDENMIFTGSFTHNDLQIALASVFKTLNIHYDILEKNVIVLKQS